MISEEKAKELSDGLNGYLESKDNHNYSYVEDISENGVVLGTDIFDGDWKHDHLYWDYLAEEYFKSINITPFKIDHQYTEDTGSDWGPAFHQVYIKEENLAKTKKSRVRKNDDGVRIVTELNSLMDLASYFDEIRVKYGLPDNGNAWNDEAMLYDYIYDVRKTLERLVDQINDMRVNGGKRLD